MTVRRGIIDEDDDMGQLKWSVASDRDPGRQPLRIGPFRRANEGLGALFVRILLEIEADEEPFARCGMWRLPVHEDKTGSAFLQEPGFETGFHILVDGGNPV